MSIDRRANGAWRVRWRTPDGKQRAKHFKTKAKARQFDIEVHAALHRGEVWDPAAGRDRVAAFAAEWLAGKVDLAPTSRARTASILENHILPRWGAVRLVDVRHQDLQSWILQLTTEGQAPRSVAKIKSTFSGILATAVRQGRLARNPAEDITLPRAALPPRRYLAVDQVEALAAAAGPHSDIIHTLAYVGLRIGELAALEVRCLQADKKRLLVDRSVTEVDGTVHWSAPKDGQRRSVPVPQFLVERLVERTAGLQPHDLIFTSPRGGVVRYRNMRRDWFDAAATAAGVPGLTPHELRHTAASLAVAQNASVLAVQRMLGHDKPSTTLDTYSDLFDQDLDDVGARLDRVRHDWSAQRVRTS